MSNEHNAKSVRRHTFAPNPSPIRRDEIRMHGLGIEIRKALIDELTAFLLNSEEHKRSAMWLAYLQLTMAALGGLLDLDLNEEACNSLADRTRVDGHLTWLEWSTDAGTRRLVLDPISACVLHQASDLDAAEKAVQTAVTSILERLIPSSLYAANANARRELFIDALTAYFRRHVPGVILAQATGALRGACVPATTLVRETGSRLANYDADPVTPLASDPPEDPQQNVKRELAPLRRALRAVQPSSASGGAPNGHLSKRRQELDLELKSILDERRVPGIAGTLIPGWLRALLRHGPSRKVLETSTLLTYSSPVFTFMSTDVGRHLWAADAEDVQDVLRNVIDSCSSSSAQKRAHLVLHHFHDYAIRTLQVEAVDWSEILSGIPEITARVDANLIFWHEVLRADSILENSKTLTPDIKLLARLYIREMWCAGLRFGECFRQRLCDVSTSLGQVTIRNTEHGRPKTRSGTRVVPLDALDATGLALLQQACERALHLGHGDPLTPLAADPFHPRWLLQRWRIANAVNQALRLATGDPSVHAHILRHTRATILADQCVLPSGRMEANPDPAQTMESLLGRPNPSQRTAHAIAQVVGQSSPDVTFGVYVHHAEFRLQREASRLIPELSHREISALVQKPVSWSHKRCHSTTIELLCGHLSAAADAHKTLDFRHGIAVSAISDLPNLDAWLRPSTDRISLLALHHLLQLSQRSELPSECMSMLLGMEDGYTSKLLASIAENSVRLGYNRGQSAPDTAWTGCKTDFDNVTRSPNGFSGSPLVSSLEAVEEDFPHVDQAMSFLHAYRRDTRVFYARNLKDLEQIVSWIKFCGVRDGDIGVLVPFVGGAIPPQVSRAFKAMPGIRIAEKRASKRRRTEAEIHLLDDKSTTAACMAHATFLWIVRASVHMISGATAKEGIT